MLRSNHAAIPHMENVKGKWKETSSDTHARITLSATLCFEGYCAIKAAAPSKSAKVWSSTQIEAIPNTGAVT